MAANLQMLLYACKGPTPAAAAQGTDGAASSSPGSASGGGTVDDSFAASDSAARRLLGGAGGTLWGGYTVEFRLNERPVPLPDPTCHGQVRCPLHVVAAVLQKRLEELGVGECTQEEWTRACGGLLPC